jgi:hypothetical protein
MLYGHALAGQQYGSAASDDACATMLELRVPEYRFVRRYLERSPQARLSLLAKSIHSSAN